MTYKELSINEKINIKSWLKYLVNESLPYWMDGKYEIVLMPYITFLDGTKDNFLLRVHRDIPCDKETLLFRSNWNIKPITIICYHDQTRLVWQDLAIL